MDHEEARRLKVRDFVQQIEEIQLSMEKPIDLLHVPTEE